jgi:putative ABC transport system ATP-binding protein
VLAIFEQLHAEGVSVVLVTHDPRVGAFAERCVKLEDGRVVADDWVTERTVLEVA